MCYHRWSLLDFYGLSGCSLIPLNQLAGFVWTETDSEDEMSPNVVVISLIFFGPKQGSRVSQRRPSSRSSGFCRVGLRFRIGDARKSDIERIISVLKNHAVCHQWAHCIGKSKPRPNIFDHKMRGQTPLCKQRLQQSEQGPQGSENEIITHNHRSNL